MTYKHFTVVFNDDPLESATRWSQSFAVYVDGKLIYEHKPEPTRVFEGVVTNLQISTPENTAIGNEMSTEDDYDDLWGPTDEESRGDYDRDIERQRELDDSDN